MRKLGEVSRHRGNQLKPVAIMLFNSAKAIIDTGILLWTFKRK